MANTSPDPGTKALLLVVAESYGRLADRAEARLGASSDKDKR